MDLKNLSCPPAIKDLVDVLQGELIGDCSAAHVSGIATLDRAGPEDLSFYTGSRYADQLKQTKACAVLVSEIPDEKMSCALIKVRDVYLSLAYLLPVFYPPVHCPPGIHPSAVIDKSAAVDETCSIGARAVICKGARVGHHTILYPGVCVGENATIGPECIIYPNVTIYHHVSIGSRVIIHAGAIIGSDGFGYAKDGEKYVKIAQIGTVEIKDDVEIGANCTIDRGSTGVTVIERGVKIDNLVHIAHNVSIGENSAIAAQTGIAGSTAIGRNATFGGQVGVSGHVHVGDNVTLTARATIMKHTPSNQVISGFPQMPHRQWKRNQVVLRRAFEWMEMVKEMSERIQKLESEVAYLKIRGKEISSDCENSYN
jgi:UDP-3-O-[3-hydroxymyristoyl] glucosamine N-acyltransferase